MDWTQEIPTAPGHYWMHFENNDPQVIEFRMFPDGLKCQLLDSPMSWLWADCFLPGVSFMGPIPRPERPVKPEGETAEDVYEAMRASRMRANTVVMGEGQEEDYDPDHEFRMAMRFGHGQETLDKWALERENKQLKDRIKALEETINKL